LAAVKQESSAQLLYVSLPSGRLGIRLRELSV